MSLEALRIGGPYYRNENITVPATHFVAFTNLQSLKLIGVPIEFDCTLRVARLHATIKSLPPSLPSLLLNLRKARLVLSKDHWNIKSSDAMVDPNSVQLPEQNYAHYRQHFFENGKTSLFHELLLMFRQKELHIISNAYVPVWPIAHTLMCEKLRFNKFSVVARNTQLDSCFLK